MALQNNSRSRPGLFHIPEYQASAIPWVTSSLVIPASTASNAVAVSFPNVTRFFTIKNTDATTDLRVGFSDNGVRGVGGGGANYFVLTTGESYTAEMKVSKLFLLSDGSVATTATVIAGLTFIPNGELIENWSGSNGVY